MKIIMNLINGFCMALADSVPGVSGGTIAFLLGFYDHFIGALDSLIAGKKEEKIQAIKYLFKLGIGWVIGLVLAVLALTSIFESHIYQVSSLFLGFILFAIPIIILEEKEVLKGKYWNIIFTLIGIGVVLLIGLLSPAGGEGFKVDIANLNIGLGIYIFLVAMVAISAMVLPGISGSTILLICGIYVPIVSALKEVLTLNFAYLPVVIIFGLGVLTGIICVIRLIKKCLEKFRSQSIYCILGLMLGSLYSIVQGPTTLDVAQLAMNLGSFHIVFFILGGVIILGLQGLKKFFDSKQEIKEIEEKNGEN